MDQELRDYLDSMKKDILDGQKSIVNRLDELEETIQENFKAVYEGSDEIAKQLNRIKTITLWNQDDIEGLKHVKEDVEKLKRVK
ncbi:hypothetical protein [Metaclostridioides mangenotii]|uniref:hypothetical protein n=1 Tax=Metaclostridioides mangenotii TaxID=1540 RepID=UPI000465F87A|nr:hypothetical protein [Clostridioides mangenotii]